MKIREVGKFISSQNEQNILLNFVIIKLAVTQLNFNIKWHPKNQMLMKMWIQENY